MWEICGKVCGNSLKPSNGFMKILASASQIFLKVGDKGRYLDMAQGETHLCRTTKFHEFC